MDQVTSQETFNIGIASQSGSVPPLTPPSRPDVFSPEHQDNGNYTVYTQDIEYPTDTGIRLLPTSGGAGDCVPVRVHRGMSMKIVKGTAERRHKQPVIPSPDTGDPNEVLVSALFYPASPVQLFNAIVHRASWVYTYHLKKPKMPGDTSSVFPLGSSPAELQTSSQRYYDYNQFSKAINDASARRDSGTRVQIDIPLRST